MATPSLDASQQAPALPDQPPTSQSDDGLSRRPRDARLIHLVLSSLGIHSYQERVPLQLIDFAYRYTSSVLSDALRLSSEGYTNTAGTTTTASGRRGGGGGDKAGGEAATDGSGISVSALRQAVASRQDFCFQGPALPKEWMLEQATERNRVVLPKVDRAWGVLLPPEKYCLTGTGWGIKDEWESEGEDGEDDGVDEKELTLEGALGNGKAAVNGDGEISMGGMDGAEGEEEDEEGGGTFEDVFGAEEDRDMDES